MTHSVRRQVNNVCVHDVNTDRCWFQPDWFHEASRCVLDNETCHHQYTDTSAFDLCHIYRGHGECGSCSCCSSACITPLTEHLWWTEHDASCSASHLYYTYLQIHFHYCHYSLVVVQQEACHRTEVKEVTHTLIRNLTSICTRPPTHDNTHCCHESSAQWLFNWSHLVISLQPPLPPLTCVSVHSTHLSGRWVRHPPPARGPGAIISGGPVDGAGQQAVCLHPGCLHVSLQQLLLSGENESSRDGVRPSTGPAEPDPVLNSQGVQKLTEIQTTQPASSTRQRNVFLGSVSALPPPSLPPPVASITLHWLHSNTHSTYCTVHTLHAHTALTFEHSW